ncbi:hypothetical protein GEV33_009428 [Tenebrio molitor]|uniref:Uncharacterized protein n=1 Tax=Tenebrio molitor TaxID=7067 RepID=A0A8J6HGS3_TENMO|nr:hypothetical protein GEV33_009428 [Tenebrio molitor]
MLFSGPSVHAHCCSLSVRVTPACSLVAHVMWPAWGHPAEAAAAASPLPLVLRCLAQALATGFHRFLARFSERHHKRKQPAYVCDDHARFLQNCVTFYGLRGSGWSMSTAGGKDVDEKSTSFQPGSNFEITVLAIKFVIGMLLLYGVGVVVKACQSASHARFGTESCSEDSVRNENSRVQSHPPRRRRRDRRRDAGRLRGLCPAFRGQADLHLASSRPAQTVDESPRSETEISPPHDNRDRNESLVDDVVVAVVVTVRACGTPRDSPKRQPEVSEVTGVQVGWSGCASMSLDHHPLEFRWVVQVRKSVSIWRPEGEMTYPSDLPGQWVWAVVRPGRLRNITSSAGNSQFVLLAERVGFNARTFIFVLTFQEKRQCNLIGISKTDFFTFEWM